MSINDILIGLEFDPLIVSMVLGPFLSVAYAAFDIPSWSANKRRVIVLAAAAVLALGVWLVGVYPWAWQYVVSVWAVVLASAQTAFTILKRFGVIDWIGRATPGGEEYQPRHSNAREETLG